MCKFVRLCHFFIVHENFLWHCLGISLPQECPSFFFTSDTCDVLFCLKSCSLLRSRLSGCHATLPRKTLFRESVAWHPERRLRRRLKVMRLPSDCETDYKHGGPVRWKQWCFSSKWSFLLPNLQRVLEDDIRKISSVNDFQIRTPFSCLVILRFHPLYIFILCFDI